MEKSSNRYIIFAVSILIIIVIVVVLVLTVGKKPNNSSAPTGSKATADKAQITKAWQTFFSLSTSLAQRENILQNGSQFTQSINSEFKALGSASPSVSISSIKLTSSSAANVVYTVDLNKQPVLSNQSGQALLISNTWKVSDSTFCQLLSLGGAKPQVCQNT
jgi:hypothetical protein